MPGLVDIDEAKLVETTEMVTAAAGSAELVMSSCIDVSDRDEVFGLAEAVFERFGEVGFLLSNAGSGIGSPSCLREFDKWSRSLDVNLMSALHVFQAFIPRMVEQRTRCTIVTTGSKQGITTPPGNLAYNVAKAGLKVITEGLQHELRAAAEGGEILIEAHLFVPGFVNTDLAINYFRHLRGEAFDEAKDVPWSEAKPSKGGWMPDETINYVRVHVHEHVHVHVHACTHILDAR